MQKFKNKLLLLALSLATAFSSNATCENPTIVEKHVTTCLSDNFEVNGEIYNFPIDTTITTTSVGSDGCDSITKLHLTVLENGVINKDTTIHIGQMLYGKTFDSVGSYEVSEKFFTEVGCSITTIWRIQVIDCKATTINKDTMICKGQVLFGDTFNTAGLFYVKRLGFNKFGCSTDTVWNVRVPEISVKIFAQDVLNSDKKEKQLDVKINTNGFGSLLIPDYHWEPEISSDDLLNPIVSPTETTTYTIYVDLNNVGGMSDEENGCHVKESITINVDSAVDDILANPSSKDNNYYNLNGQKVVAPESGKVYINNGKKIMYK